MLAELGLTRCHGSQLMWLLFSGFPFLKQGSMHMIALLMEGEAGRLAVLLYLGAQLGTQLGGGL